MAILFRSSAGAPVVGRRTLIVAILFAFSGQFASHAEVIFSGDPDYPTDAVVFTTDPEDKGTGQRGIAATRNLRQTFQVPITFDVAQIVVSINVEPAATTAGFELRIYEVADVMSAWSPGNLVKEFIFPTLPGELPGASTLRMGLTLSGSDIFTLPARNTGAEGYGIEFSNNNDVDNFGLIKHTNDGTDYYTGGQYYSETAAFATRDIGLALVATPGGGLILGDTNGNGTGGEFPADFDPIRANFRTAVTLRTDGDLVPNGIVDFADFREWKAAFLAGGGSLSDVDLGVLASVPEPATWMLGAIAALGVGRSRARIFDRVPSVRKTRDV